jgi:hypothetical protein
MRPLNKLVSPVDSFARRALALAGIFTSLTTIFWYLIPFYIAYFA